MIAVFDPFMFNVMTDVFRVLWPSCYLSSVFPLALYFQFCFGLVKYFLAFHSISSVDLSFFPPLSVCTGDCNTHLEVMMVYLELKVYRSLPFTLPAYCLPAFIDLLVYMV